MKYNKYLTYIITYNNFLFIKSWERSISKREDVFICDFVDYKYNNLCSLFRGIMKSILPICLVAYFIFKLIKHVLFKLFTCNKRYAHFMKLYINTDNGLKTAICKNLIRSDDYVLEFPYKISKNIACNKIGIESVSSWRIMVISFFNSVCSLFVFIRKKGISSVVYLFTAFDYFLLYNSLDSIEYIDELIISNQKDRWAYMIGTLRHKNKTIVQHGTVLAKGVPSQYMFRFVEYSVCDKLFYLNMPYKLSGFNKIISFSHLEYKYMLLSEHQVQRDNIVNENVGYNLSLTNLFDDNKINILIIGNSNQRSFEEEQLIEFFVHNADYRLLLKPHPVFPKTVYKKYSNIDNFYLMDNEVFPVVHFVISYYSTLALEYECAGIKVVYYDDLCHDGSGIISFDILIGLFGVKI